MSFDVAFWRYSETLDHDHVAVHAALAAGSRVDGLSEIDAEAMIECLAGHLSAWERVDEQTWERPKHFLQVSSSSQHLSINMSFGAARPVLLKITTPLRRFHCGLWNPQTNQRLPGYDEAEAKSEK